MVFGSRTASAAFKKAVREAQTYYGNGGYTGTIAEKTHFEMADEKAVTLEQATERIQAMFRAEDRKLDKWGPALCFKVKQPNSPVAFVFFGIASC